MDITRYAIDNSRVTTIFAIVIIVAGINAYLTMPRNEDPGFIVRVAMVQTFFPGASPERVEMLVTDKLEKAIQEIAELDFISSTSKVGVSIIYVNVKEEYTRMRPLWDKLRRKVEKARTELPAGIIGPIVNDEFGDVFGTIVSLNGEGFDYRELKDIADGVRDELLLIQEVAKVEIYGAQEERIFVEYDNARLAEFGLSPIQLQQLLQSRNIILPGGDVDVEYERVVLEPTGNLLSVDDLRRVVINLPGADQLVRLEDLVRITRGYIDPPEAMMRSTGLPSLALAVSMREGGNILDMGEQISAVIDRARSVYPIGIEFDVIQFQSDVVRKKTDDFVGNLLGAVGIVGLVMLLFLGLRTGLIVASLIPTAILFSLFVMNVLGIGLDQMSLAALIIALGMLVDNAIVMSESIMVQMAAGKRCREAAIQSARELRVPLLTSSLTTAAAFLPIYLSESATGEYTAPLFKVVSITLLCSWVVALTIIPALCALFLRVKQQKQEFDSPFYRSYRGTLLGVLRRPWLSLASVVVVFLMAMQGFRFIPNIFFPENDRPTFTMDIELPAGTPIARTERVVQEIEEFMLDNLIIGEDREAGIVNWASFIGQGAPRFVLAYNPEPSNPSYAYFVINTTDDRIIDEDIIPPIETFIVDNFPDVNPTVRKLPLGAPAWPPVSIRISGRETDVLFEIADQVKARLRETPGARQVSDDWGARSKKLMVNIDETRAQRAGVSNQDIAISLQTYLSGLETTEYREGDKLIPVVLRSAEGRVTTNTDFRALNVYSQATGQSVPFSQVADLELVWQPGIIERRNRLRTVTIEALLEPGYTAVDVTGAIQPWLEDRSAEWPFGFYWEFGGEIETSVKANLAIAEKLPVAGLVIVLLLVWQFNSFRRPVIILATIPLALIGVVVGLLVVRSYFGFMTLLGIISLAGIVINNAIVLIDRIRIEQQENALEAHQAIVMAAQQRLRPILLTAATTIGGLVPLWIGGGPMWEPMAITIIFGLLFSTVLTLGVVPLLYSLLFRVRFERA